MKATELIEQLEALIEIYGDQEVNFDHGPDKPVGSVTAYDKHGDVPVNKNDCSEFFIQ